MSARLLILLVMLLPAVLPACSSEREASARDTGEYENYMLILSEGYANRKLGPVKFTHDAHWEDYGIFCDDCHHDYVDGKNVWTEDDEARPCISCHKPDKPQGTVYKLSTAYHKSCRTCHRDMNAGGPEYAPFSCYSCHERKTD